MEQLIIPAAQLGGTVFTVVAFLWYLTKLLNTQNVRDNNSIIASNLQSKSNITLAQALQKLTDTVRKNSTISLTNTDAITKNTDVVKKTNGNH